MTAFLSQRADRQALWLPVAFACGIGLYFALDFEPVPWLAPALFLSSLGLFVLARLWPERQGIALLVIWILFASAGFTVVQTRANYLAAPVLEKKQRPLMVEGTIAKMEFRRGGLRLTLEELAIPKLETDQIPAKVRITSRFDQPDLAPGDRVKVLAILMPPPEAALPGGFDFVRRAWFEQIGAVGYSIAKVHVTGQAEDLTLHRVVGDYRQRISQRILAAFPEDKTAGHLAAALMTGRRGGVGEDVMQAMRDAGLAHLLAISGLHIGLLAGLVFFASRALLALVEPFALRYPIKKLAAVCALAGAFFYLLMTGATVPTQRAFLMTGLVLVAVMLDRRAISMGLVAWAAGAVLLIAPESLTGPGFQMSFAAVIALIGVYERSQAQLIAWRRQPGISRRVLLYVFGVMLTSLVASLATSPFAVAHFGRLASWGLAANLIAVPVMALWIMPWALAAFVLMPLGLEHWALVAMGQGINLMLDVARTVAAWPGAVQFLPAVPTHALVLIALGALWMCLWRPAKAVLTGHLFGVAVIAAGVGLWSLAQPPVAMIDGKGRLFGLMTDDGRLRVSNRRDSFTLRSWLAEQGIAKADPLIVYSGPGKRRSDLRCDSLGCIYRKKGQTIAVVKDSQALDEDCQIASVIFATVPLKQRCLNAAIRIDRFDLWRNGAHALWVNDKGLVRAQSVAEARGQRLWTPMRQRKNESGLQQAKIVDRSRGPEKFKQPKKSKPLASKRVE